MILLRMDWTGGGLVVLRCMILYDVYIFSSCFSTMILSCSVFSFQSHVVINAFI